jgi:hypothetical protein
MDISPYAGSFEWFALQIQFLALRFADRQLLAGERPEFLTSSFDFTFFFPFLFSPVN